MAFGDVVDQLHDEHRLAHASTAEESDFTTLHVGFEQVDDLDTGGEHLFLCGEFLEFGCLAVYGIGPFHVELLHAVDGLSDDVEHTPLDLVSGRHEDGVSGRDGLQSALQSVGIVHSDAPDGVLADVLLHLDDEFFSVRSNHFESIVDFRQHFLSILSLRIIEYVDNRADNL